MQGLPHCPWVRLLQTFQNFVSCCLLSVQIFSYLIDIHLFVQDGSGDLAG